jgi:ribosomal protein L32
MACENFTRSDDHPNKCANCGEYISAHITTADDDD